MQYVRLSMYSLLFLLLWSFYYYDHTLKIVCEWYNYICVKWLYRHIWLYTVWWNRKKVTHHQLTEKSQNNTTYKQLTAAFIGNSQTILKIKLIEKKRKKKKITRTFSCRIFFNVGLCLQRLRTIRDGKPRSSTSSFTQLLSSWRMFLLCTLRPLL